MNAALVAAVAVASFLTYGAVAVAIRVRARRSRPPTVVEGTGFARWIPYFVFVPYVVLALRPGPEIPDPEAVRWLGIALIVAGPAVSIWAAATLGRHFDLDVEVHGGHEVIRSGPYAIVRHPIYAGLSLHYVGACLATGNLLFIAGTLGITFPAFVARASAEERLLRRELGEAYDRYAREVPMLIPFPRILGALSVALLLTACVGGPPGTPDALADEPLATATPLPMRTQIPVPTARRGDPIRRMVPVSGTVRTPSGVAVDGVRVVAFQAGVGCCLAAATAITRDGGRYTLGIITGRYYVAFIPPAGIPYATTWFGDVPEPAETIAQPSGVALRVGLTEIEDADVELFPSLRAGIPVQGTLVLRTGVTKHHLSSH